MSDFPNRGFYRGNRAAMLKDVGLVEQSQEQSVRRAEETTAEQETSATSVGEALSSREAARGSGYTGDQCSNCNSLRMKVSGHCMVCEDCGTTTGCS